MTIFLILFLGIVVVFCIALSKLPDQDPSLLYQTKIFGEYTRKIKWDDNYILYNEKTRRILLYDGYTPEDLNEIIYDTGVIKKLDITENEARNGVDFGKEVVTTTDWDSALNRGMLGGLLFGKVGAVVGVLTADQKKEIRNTTTYIRYPADYTIVVYDDKETCIGYYITTDKEKYLLVKNLLQEIIKTNELESSSSL